MDSTNYDVSEVKRTHLWWCTNISIFYPRPILAFRCCCCLRLCVYVSVNHNFSRAKTCHPLKLESPNLDHEGQTSCLRSFFFWGSLTLTFKVTLNLKSKFGLWICPCDKAIEIEVRLFKFGQKMHLSTVKVCIDFGIDWLWCSVLLIIWNLLISTKSASLIHFRRFVYI